MSQGRRYAILIGSGRFDREPNLSQLKCPENDVDGMREILAAAEFGAFGKTFVFKDAENHAVLRCIDEVLADATRDDQVLIYYSGHGETDLPGRLYLTTANTEVRRLVSTSIPVETLRLFIENSSCRKIILILDCCYGGAVGRSFSRGSVDEKLKELARGSGVYILTASTASQTAQEREGDDYGLLTKHIISGIKRGEADVNDDGFVSMDDLYSYVFAKVMSEGYQEPMRWALNVKGEDLIIARAGGTPGREKQRLLNEKIIEFRDFLPRQIFLKALQIIDERRMPFYGLIDELYRQHLQIGEFIEEWYRLEFVERQQPSEPSRAQPQPQPEERVKSEVVEKEPQPPPPSAKPQAPSRSEEQPLPQSPPAKPFSSTDRRPRAVESKRLFVFLKDRRNLMRGGLAVAGAAIALFVILIITLPTNKTGSPTTTKSPAPPGSSPILSSVGFETVALDSHGKEVNRRKLQAEYFTEDLNGVPLEMMKIPGGTFTMGSPGNEAERDNDEGPQHNVTVPEFYIGRFEVTREQWRQVARMPKVKIDLNEYPSGFKDSRKQPVEQVSWAEAIEFCKRLETKTGKPYRLPSEAEWEYAARAGTTTPFAFGATITPQVVNYDGNYPYGSAPKGIYRQKTVEVGSLGIANAFGLYDLHGNVWEWCEDVWHDDYKGAPGDGSAWLSGGDSGRHVLRGGSWLNDGRLCSSAYRDGNGAGDRIYYYGFRVVLAARTR